MGYFYDALRPDEHFVTCLNSSARDILDVSPGVCHFAPPPHACHTCLQHGPINNKAASLPVSGRAPDRPWHGADSTRPPYACAGAELLLPRGSQPPPTLTHATPTHGAQVVRWARSHDAEARRIAETAQRFAVEHLRRSARLCQIRTVIEELGRRMRCGAYRWRPERGQHA